MRLLQAGLGALALLGTNAALAEKPAILLGTQLGLPLGGTLGVPLGNRLGLTLGSLLGEPLGNAMTVGGVAVLLVGALSLVVGISIIRRKRAR